MRHLLYALVVTLAALSTARAQTPPAKSPFSNKSLGEGGGYTHPTADVGQFFETKPKPEEKKPAEEKKPETKPAPAKPAPAKAEEKKKSLAAKSAPEAIPVPPQPVRAGAPARTEPAAKESVADAAPVKRETPPARAAAASSDGGLDAASDDARRDYETKLFGAAEAPRRPQLADPAFSPSLEAAPAAAAGEGMLFVSLELDSQEAGTLRDAVAGLGAAAAFRPDARFQPMPGAAGSVRVSGWLPASRLGDAIARPGVKRVEVERGGRPSGDDRLSASYLVKLRVADPSRADESIAESVRELTAATGFALERVLGVEKAPGGGSTALVSGTMPVSRLSRALGLSSVIKLAAAPAAEAPLPAEASPKPARKDGFVRFVMDRALWLVLLTVLLALPAVSGAVKKGLAVFVPYR